MNFPDASLWRTSVAPMMDWTDRHCRYFHRLLSRNTLLYTEMVTTGALVDAQALAALALLPLAGTRPLRRWLLRLPRRAHLWLRATYLRVRIAAAEIDMEALAELETAPEQIALHKACIDVWRVQLTDCELAARAE